jgi:hypothetical protein
VRVGRRIKNLRLPGNPSRKVKMNLTERKHGGPEKNSFIKRHQLTSARDLTTKTKWLTS